MVTNHPDTINPALLRPGRSYRKVEFGLPDLECRGHILKIHSKRMNCDQDIHFELVARLCPNTTGAELHSVCTEAGMYASGPGGRASTRRNFSTRLTRWSRDTRSLKIKFKNDIKIKIGEFLTNL